MLVRPLLVVLSLALVASISRAEIIIPHVGRLAKNDTPVTGSQRLRFALYKDPAGEDGLVWEDIYEEVQVYDGLYKVELGDQTPITRDDLSVQATLWLEVSLFDGSQRIDLLPRMRFEPSAQAHYARDSASLGGFSADKWLKREEFDLFKTNLTGGSSGAVAIPWSKITGTPARLQVLLDDGLTKVVASGAISGRGTQDVPLSLKSDSIGVEHLKDGSVTSDKLAADALSVDVFPTGGIPAAKISGCPQGGILKFQGAFWQCSSDDGLLAVAASGALSGFGTAASPLVLNSNSIGSGYLQQASVTGDKLADEAVTSDKLKSDAAGLVKVTDGAAVVTNQNLGVGTATPAYRLDVHDKSAISGAGLVRVHSGETKATMEFDRADTQLALGDIVVFGAHGRRMVTSVSPTSFDFLGPALSNTTSYTQLPFSIIKPTARLGSLNVTAEGNVGIGTNAPRARLHVAGDVDVNRNLSVDQDLNVVRDAKAGRNLTVAQDLNVTRDARANRNLTVGQNLSVNGLLKANGSRIIRNVSVQANGTSYSATTTWVAGPTFANITGFKGGSLVRLTYHIPMRNDNNGWGGGYIEPQISFDNSTWRSLGSSGYDGGVMTNSGAAIGSYSNTILVNPGLAGDYSVRVRFYFRSYEGTVVINGNHDINSISGTAALMPGINGNQHYAKIIVEELY